MTPPERKFPKVITALVVVSVVVNVVIAVAVGFLAVYSVTLAQRNAQNAAAIHASQLESCHTSNVARGRDIAIWNRLLKISPAQRAAESPAQRLEVTQLEHLVKVKDTPVNCAALYPATAG